MAFNWYDQDNNPASPLEQEPDDNTINLRREFYKNFIREISKLDVLILNQTARERVQQAARKAAGLE